jgi:N-acetylglucosamine-6-phosphate deacetylase
MEQTTSMTKTAQPIAFVNSTAITPYRAVEKECIVVEKGKIVQCGSLKRIEVPPKTVTIDCSGKYVVPGFMDLHVHGGGGYSFHTLKEKELAEIERYFISHGTTNLLATLYIDERDSFIRSIGFIADYCARKKTESTIFGLHIEGPFINKNLKGALSEKYIWKPSAQNWNVLSKSGHGSIKLMTIAPELPGALEVMRQAVQEGVVLCIAHSEAQYDEIGRAHV